MASQEQQIFRDGSTTYYWSSKFFPKGVRDDVFKLYSFVRVVDDMVDQTPPETERFKRMVKRWQTVKKQLAKGEVQGPLDDSVDERVLANMAHVVHRFECDPAWVDAFLESMKMDVDQKRYKTLDDTLEYIYGSAEVIGLFMAKIMQLPVAPYEFARMQGRAMQFINFLRDIDEDNQLGRQYFPDSALKQFGLKDLSHKTAQKNPDKFAAFMREQLELYDQWQAEAYKGYSYIPKRLRVPLQTATDMYNWTAEQIRENPMVVFDKKVKPKKSRVISTAAKRAIY